MRGVDYIAMVRSFSGQVNEPTKKESSWLFMVGYLPESLFWHALLVWEMGFLGSLHEGKDKDQHSTQEEQSGEFRYCLYYLNDLQRFLV